MEAEGEMETSLYSWYAGHNISFNHIILLIKIRKQKLGEVLWLTQATGFMEECQDSELGFCFVSFCFVLLQTVKCLLLINGGEGLREDIFLYADPLVKISV